MHDSHGPGQPSTRVAIAGLGAVGMRLATALDTGLPGFELAAIAVRDKPAARVRLAGLRREIPLIDIDELEPLAESSSNARRPRCWHRSSGHSSRPGRRRWS